MRNSRFLYLVKVSVTPAQWAKNEKKNNGCTMCDFHDFGLTWKCQKCALGVTGCTITSTLISAFEVNSALSRENCENHT